MDSVLDFGQSRPAATTDDIIAQDAMQLEATLTDEMPASEPSITPDTTAANPNDKAIFTADAEESAKPLSVAEYMRDFILCNQASMNETTLAKALGISRKSLWERRNKLGIPRKPKAKT